MCGIVGYVGAQNAVPILLSGLARLEYRGYDSAGIAVGTPTGVAIRKLVGHVCGLKRNLDDAPLTGTFGIAHTRWATHGAATELNAHPHVDCVGRIALVHNGIIENADILRRQLATEGHAFTSETDTETLVHLIERSTAGSLEARVIEALSFVEGTFGIAAIDIGEPDKIVVARRGSPVLLGIGDGELYVASDASAIIERTRSVVYLNDGDIAVLTRDGYRIIDADTREQSRQVSTIDWDLESLALGTYEHFMQKEIHEQAETVAQTLRGRLVFADGDSRLNGLNLDDVDFERIKRVLIVACGTSWHAGLVGQHLIEQLAGVPCTVEVASEFRYRRRLPLRDTLTIAISQSGETADTLEALRAARASESRVVGIVNVVGSTVAREADGGIYLHAGPEIGVASTKAFTSQVVALTLFALHLGRRRGLTRDEGRRIVEHLIRLPDQIERVFALEPRIRDIAEQYAHSQSAMFLGRGFSMPVALEGALKLKEIAYIHAEGYPAAEMKHGPIALVDENMPVVFIAPKDDVYAKSVSNMQEMKARRGQLIAISSEGNGDLRGLANHQLCVPMVPSWLSPVLTVMPLQMLAYHTAVLRGCDVDRPRNLAKSVTVE